MNAAQQTAKQLSSVTFFEFRNILKSWRFIIPLAITLGIFAMEAMQPALTNMIQLNF